MAKKETMEGANFPVNAGKSEARNIIKEELMEKWQKEWKMVL